MSITLETDLPVLVITRELECPAFLALTLEGLKVTVARMRDYTNWGRVFYEQWQSKHGFICVEEDIVPWPGAVLELDRCPHDWCAFEFPNGVVQEEPRTGFCLSLGCMKFSTALVNKYLPQEIWHEKGWDELDGSVFGPFHADGLQVHVHTPPVAHAKFIFLESYRRIMPL